MILDIIGGPERVLDAIPHRDAAVKIAAEIQAGIVSFESGAGGGHLLVPYSILGNRPWPSLQVKEIGLALDVQQFGELPDNDCSQFFVCHRFDPVTGSYAPEERDEHLVPFGSSSGKNRRRK